jgi:hypothetical protein
MSKSKINFFWASYSDLMTSLFFIMLVLFVLTVVMLKRRIISTQEQLKKIEELQTAVKQLPEKYFEYQIEYKRFKLKKQINFATGDSIIQQEDFPYLIDVGKSINNLIKSLYSNEQYKEFDIKYLVVIEGMASIDPYPLNFELSYKRALSLYKLWRKEFRNDIIFDPKYCEIQIAGSGTDGIREFSGVDERKNQQFLIHIVPKIGKFNDREENYELGLKREEIVSHYGSIDLFRINNFKVEITNQRPSEKDQNIFLCVPAAFTSPNSTIDGLFIKNGEVINSITNANLNGTLIIDSNKDEISIQNFSSLEALFLIDRCKKNKLSTLQQFLLIRNGKLLVNDPWKGKPNQRRALGIKGTEVYIIESQSPLSINDFQGFLLDFGIQDAIYLDMGTYSSGWRRQVDRVLSIGKEATSSGTSKQTNWLILRKKINV